MKRVYLLVYDVDIPREAVKTWADTSRLVETWRYDMPHSFYLVSESPAASLARDLAGAFGPAARFLITPVVPEECEGQMVGDTWHFLLNKSPGLLAGVPS